jgi:hypothetical protein
MTGLISDKRYNLFVDMIMVDFLQWKFLGGVWTSFQTHEKLEKTCFAYMHPDSPQTGSFWMKKEIQFSKLKLSNHNSNNSGNIQLNSMHRYLPRIHLQDADNLQSSFFTYTFMETEFIAVTAYQNLMITELKIYNNPFAKGFRNKNNEKEADTEVDPWVQQAWEVISKLIHKSDRNHDDLKERPSKKAAIEAISN